MSLSEEYHAEQTIIGKLDVLKRHYKVEKKIYIGIDMNVPSEFLARRIKAELRKTEPSESMEYIDYANYLALHEFLHVWLEETGRTFSVEQKDKDLEEYLFCLKNMFNDYLIETEVKKQFGEDYASTYKKLRDSDLGIKFNEGLRDVVPASSIAKIMFVLTYGLVQEVYPSIADSDSDSRKLIKELKRVLNVEFMATQSQYDSNVSPEQYLEGINSLNYSLTGSRLEFISDEGLKYVKFEDPFKVKQEIRRYSNLYDWIIEGLRKVCGIQQPEDIKPAPDNVRTLIKDK